MRHHVLVRQRLKRLHEEHGLTEEQLKAVTPYLVKLEHYQLKEVKCQPIDDNQFVTWYSPLFERS